MSNPLRHDASPLDGLIDAPFEGCTDDEIRERVQKLHEYRTNAQAFYTKAKEPTAEKVSGSGTKGLSKAEADLFGDL